MSDIHHLGMCATFSGDVRTWCGRVVTSAKAIWVAYAATRKLPGRCQSCITARRAGLKGLQ